MGVRMGSKEDTYEGDTYGLWQTEDCMKWDCIRFLR